ncbi:MAG: nuclear transport factor 2 family protein [Caulobacteraceae bacterium]|nr:nuclear transport factor 2 family protein [Caulobacteraceae bacterium]
MNEDLAARLDRVESTLAIQQLPIRYAMAVGSRDVDTWVSLFVDDVNCGRHGVGREVLRQWITPALEKFYRSIHQVCGHRIEFVDADNARGQVYCRAEHEYGDKWIVMAICYFDTYTRRNGEWFFVRRNEQRWYSQDITQRPNPPFNDWLGSEMLATLPAGFPTWAAFWGKVDERRIQEVTSAPVHAPSDGPAPRRRPTGG